MRLNYAWSFYEYLLAPLARLSGCKPWTPMVSMISTIFILRADQSRRTLAARRRLGQMKGRVQQRAIDNGVDPAHEVFSGLTLHQDGCSGRVVPHEHGTAVASLMVGRAPTFHGAAPGAVEGVTCSVTREEIPMPAARPPAAKETRQ